MPSKRAFENQLLDPKLQEHCENIPRKQDDQTLSIILTPVYAHGMGAQSLDTVQFDTVQFTVDNGIAIIWLDRPEHLNAVTPELVEDLLSALDIPAKAAINEANAIKVIVLAGKGRAFCAGHDLKQPAPSGDARKRLQRLQEVTRRLKSLQQPVIAAVQGYAIGAGAEFALGCDLIVAEEKAIFAFPEASLGLSVTGAASRLLPMLVGPAKAKELLLLGERIDAATAERIGLINTIAHDGQAVEKALSWAQKIRDFPAESVTMAKQALDFGVDATLAEALDLEVEHALQTESSPALKETLTKFRERP